MEKVKLTKEQVVTLETAIELNGFEGVVRQHVEGGWTTSTLKALNDLSVDKLVRALYIGYEVDSQYKIGDWVVLEDGYIGEIEFINEVEGWANVGYSKDTKERGVCLARTYDLIDIKRHATPSEIAQEKERRWFAKHGRKPWELKKKDVLKFSNGNFYEVESVDELEKVVFFENGEEMYLNQVELNFTVVCFADERKDIKA